MNVASDVPGVELLQEGEDEDDNGSDDAGEVNFNSSSDNDLQDDEVGGTTELHSYSDLDGSGSSDAFEYESDCSSGSDVEIQSENMQEDDEISGDEDEDASNYSDNEGGTSEEDNSDEEVKFEESIHSEKTSGGNIQKDDGVNRSTKKRKLSDFDAKLNAANSSLRALKRLAGSNVEQSSSKLDDGILSNEDFQRIKELKV